MLTKFAAAESVHGNLSSVLPDELLSAVRWVVWKFVPYAAPEKKPRKVPYYPNGSPRGVGLLLDSPDDVRQLGTIEAATALVQRGGYDGVGYAVTLGDGVGGIDLDDCLDANGDVTSDIARQVYDCAKASGCYIEISPSGKGLRIIGSTAGFTNFNRGGCEAYDSRRYLTITGNVVENPKGFGDIDSAVKLLDRLTSPRDSTTNTGGSALLSALGTGGYAVPELVDKGGRNDALLRYASHLRGSGVPEHLILGLVRDFNLARCRPPLDDAEVADVVSRYAREPISVDPDDWPEPDEIKAALPPVPAFDLDTLPVPFQAFVKDSAERMGQPADFIAIPLMIVAGAVLGSTWAVAPKEHDRRWLVPPVLWGGVIARSGTKKSACINLAVRPAQEIEKMMAAAHVQNVAGYRSQKIAYDAAVKAAQAAAAKGQFLAIPPEPKTPEPERLVVNDTTYQKLADIMRCSPRGVLSVGDELAGTMVSWEQKGQEPARAFYLTAYNGDQSYHMDRVEAGSKLIECAFLCLLGGMQPSVLSSYVRQATHGGSGDDGMVQRFQMLCWPDIPAELQEIDRAHDGPAEQAAFDALLRLRNVKAADVGAETIGRHSVLVFAAGAQALFTRFRALVTRAAKDGSYSPALSSHMAKTPAVIATLAGLIHLLEGGMGPIGPCATRKAIRWFPYLHAHALRVYASSSNARAESARMLADKIQRGMLGGQFTARAVLRKGWQGLSSPQEVDEAIQWLCDVGWLKPQERKTAGRATVDYIVNPKAFKAAA